MDWGVASQRIPGGARGIQELASIMLSEGPRLVGEIRAGMAEEDAERVRIGAHTLRGSAEYFLASDLVALASDVESLARAEDLIAVEKLLDDMEMQVQRLSAELQAVNQDGIETLVAAARAED